MRSQEAHHPALRRPYLTFQHNGEHYTIPSLLAHRYKIRSILATGGFGVVYTAIDTRIFDRAVIIKANRYPAHLFQHPQNIELQRCLDDQRKRLHHEAKMMNTASKRGIAGTPVLIDLIEDTSLQLYGPHRTPEGDPFVLDTSVFSKEPYLVMSSIEGETLSHVCQSPSFRNNRFRETKTVGIQLCGILDAFHRYEEQKGNHLCFVYQDLKPENILWSKSRKAFLIDFGSFAVRTPQQVSAQNRFVSTPPYQPPEFASAFSAEEAIQPQADIFSLGVTLLHLLRGHAPLNPSTGELSLQLDDPDIPASWKEWLSRATEPHPKDRFASMQDAQKHLLEVVSA